MRLRAASNPLVSFLMAQRRALPQVLILTHDHPDPDAVASAWALARLCEEICGSRTRIVYGGVIGRMENQMLVRLLRVPIKPLRPAELSRVEAVALVDTQPPFQNNRFPAARRATLVVDHHARNPKTKADFSLIDPSAGATATLLSEALLAAGLDIPTRLATALVYAISAETQQLGREASPRDITAYRTLFPQASMRLLSKIQNPPRPHSFFYTLGKAIHQAFVAGRVIGVHLGTVASQDVVSHMADFLLTHEKMRWSIVTGRYHGRLHISLRTRNQRAEAGKLLWRLLGSSTSGGGHKMIAGGAILVGSDAKESSWQLVERQLSADFLKSQGYKEPFDLQYPFRAIRSHGG